MPEHKKWVATLVLRAVAIALILAGGFNYILQLTTPVSTVTIATDRTSYVLGSTINWTASGLTTGASYIVGADVNGDVYYSGSFTATASSMKGSYSVGSNVIGATRFAIGQFTSSSAIEILASTTITIS